MTMTTDLGAVLPSLPLMLKGLGVTVLLSLVSGVLATLIGLVAAAIRTSRVAGASQLSILYTEVFRGTPLLITLLFVYFGVAAYGFELNLFAAAVAGLAIYQGAYIGEIFRSGIEAVPNGQREVSQVLGFGRIGTFVHIVLPQTRRVVLPPLGGQYIALIKDTSIASLIGVAELMRQGQSVVDRLGQPVAVYAVVAALYFVVCYPASRWVRALENRNLT
ncbi:MAG: amino acid ABC transporter permease [Nostocoides sp.]